MRERVEDARGGMRWAGPNRGGAKEEGKEEGQG